MIKITQEDFSVDEILKQLKNDDVGALVTFLGVVRGESYGQQIELMEIEVYPEMAFKQLNEIRVNALERFRVDDIHIIHRFGSLKVTENIVLIAVSSAHRSEAFDACEYVIDELKMRVPIWKKEHTKDGTYWVEGKKLE
ncbi:molybdenum cofactor biosynthesis protein MoaE [Candidatus Bathyarchaeota archaeon]|nr:molybdenum cofactor biosynthesis protein MoaE [Candidatus Bathyarchaeota archaeon]